MLNTTGDLRLGRFTEFEFVEDVAGDAPVGVRGKEAKPVGTWCSEVLMPALDSNRRRKGRETQIERSELRLHASFLLLVGEGLLDGVTKRVEVIAETHFI